MRTLRFTSLLALRPTYELDPIVGQPHAHVREGGAPTADRQRPSPTRVLVRPAAIGCTTTAGAIRAATRARVEPPGSRELVESALVGSAR